jgi:hypothetical protein
MTESEAKALRKYENLSDKDISSIREKAYDLYFLISEAFKDMDTFSVVGKDAEGVELYKIKIERSNEF